MEDIKVGEYARPLDGRIGKVVEVNPNYYRKDDGHKVWKSAYSITGRQLKHSPNIIDLIEVRRQT